MCSVEFIVYRESVELADCKGKDKAAVFQGKAGYGVRTQSCSFEECLGKIAPVRISRLGPRA